MIKIEFKGCCESPNGVIRVGEVLKFTCQIVEKYTQNYLIFKSALSDYALLNSKCIRERNILLDLKSYANAEQEIASESQVNLKWNI